MYGNINGLKDRLNIPYATTTYDSSMTIALEEASRWVDLHLAPYAGTVDVYNTIEFSFSTLPLASTIVPEMIEDIAEDMAVVYFKRRDIPKGVGLTGNFGQYNETLEGYAAQASTKMETFIRTYFKQGKIVFVSGDYEIGIT